MNKLNIIDNIIDNIDSQMLLLTNDSEREKVYSKLIELLLEIYYKFTPIDVVKKFNNEKLAPLMEYVCGQTIIRLPNNLSLIEKIHFYKTLEFSNILKKHKFNIKSGDIIKKYSQVEIIDVFDTRYTEIEGKKAILIGRFGVDDLFRKNIIKDDYGINVIVYNDIVLTEHECNYKIIIPKNN